MLFLSGYLDPFQQQQQQKTVGIWIEEYTSQPVSSCHQHAKKIDIKLYL